MRTASLKPLAVSHSREWGMCVAAPVIFATSVLAAMAMRPYVSAWCEMCTSPGSYLPTSNGSPGLVDQDVLRRAATENAGAFYSMDRIRCRAIRTVSSLDLPESEEWAAIAKTPRHAAVLWGLIRLLPADRPAMIGGVDAAAFAFLHFGMFHLLALWWQRTGVAVQPIMCRPLLATSLVDFWGQRWNRCTGVDLSEYYR